MEEIHGITPHPETGEANHLRNTGETSAKNAPLLDFSTFLMRERRLDFTKGNYQRRLDAYDTQAMHSLDHKKKLNFATDFKGYQKSERKNTKSVYSGFLTNLRKLLVKVQGRDVESIELSVAARTVFDLGLELGQVMKSLGIKSAYRDELSRVLSAGVPLRKYYAQFPSEKGSAGPRIGMMHNMRSSTERKLPEILDKYKPYSSAYAQQIEQSKVYRGGNMAISLTEEEDEEVYDIFWVRLMIIKKVKGNEQREIVFGMVIRLLMDAFMIHAQHPQWIADGIDAGVVDSLQHPLYDIIGDFDVVSEMLQHVAEILESLRLLFDIFPKGDPEDSNVSVQSSGRGTFTVRKIQHERQWSHDQVDILDGFVGYLWTAPRGAGKGSAMSGMKVAKNFNRLDVALPPQATTTDLSDRICVEIPAKPSAIVSGDELIPIAVAFSQLGKKVFSRYKKLNKVQSELYDVAYRRNDSFLLTSPTGSGKTDVAMMTVLREIERGGTDLGNGVVIPAAASEFKIVYVCPMKALAAEMTANFTNRLSGIGISVKEMTGDTHLSKTQLNETHVIVTTPEKWDVVTRSSIDAASICRLLIIDEIHLLNDERGPVIEAIVARTKRQVQRSQAIIRMVGLSATLPNYGEVAAFLGVDKKCVFRFGEECRPVPLQMKFIGAKGMKDSFAIKKTMSKACFDEVHRVLQEGHQALVFVHSRKETLRTANDIVEMLRRIGEEYGDDDHRGNLRQRVHRSRNNELVSLIVNNRVGFHHAGMLRSDRSMVEDLFREGTIRVLCCTATLAWGVNLPARAVIIKGTQYYDPSKGGFVELDILDVLQIFGRAGRPQYDTVGEAMIITDHSTLPHYLKFLTNQLPIESRLPNRLADMLNAEIALGTIGSIVDAVEWLGYTFLYIRMKGQESELFDMAEAAAKLLDATRMIRYDPKTKTLSPTALGRIASTFYVCRESVEIFNEELFHCERTLASGDEDPSLHVLAKEGAALRILALSHEFAQLKVREEEEDELARIEEYVSKNYINVAGPLDTVPRKAVLLASAIICRLRINEFSLVCDSNYITQNGPRIARALFEMALSERWSAAAFEFLGVAQSLNSRWWDQRTPLGLFSKIPPTIVSKVEDAGLTIDDLVAMTPDEIGYTIRNSGYGPMISKYAGMVPRLDVTARIRTITRVIAQVDVTLRCNFKWMEGIHGKRGIGFWLWLVDETLATRDDILHSEYVTIRKSERHEERDLTFYVPLASREHRFVVYLQADHWPANQMTPLSVRDLILPISPTLHTALLQLVPLPTAALVNPLFMDCYPFSYFNAIQTQCFHTAFHEDSNLLLGAPTGSGKTAVAEFCMMRVLNTHSRKRVIYIAPLKALVRERARDWKARFGRGKLNLKIVELTGDTSVMDMAMVKSSDVICTTPEKWDSISRKWESRDYVKSVGLVIIDEVHLLGTDRGPVLEIILARLRDISRATKGHIRIVALSTACSNAGDLAEWLSVPPQGEFNFRPNVRPVPLEIHISGFSGKHYCPRMALMNKPAFEAINSFSASKPVLIFVSSRRQTRLTAFDLVRYVTEHPEYGASDRFSERGDGVRRFLPANISEERLESICSAVSDSSLRYTLAFGIGIHHAGLSNEDRIFAERLFKDGTIQILVATATLAWGVNLPAHLVIIKGTEYFDAPAGRYVDVPVTDVLQMMGRAGRPQFDTRGYVCLYTAENKKDFYRRFLHEPFPVESSLASSLADHICAEISFAHITNEIEALNFLRNSFLSIRARANPAYYGLSGEGEQCVEDYLSTLIQEVIATLVDRRCIEVSEESRMATREGRKELFRIRELRTTKLGDIASFYYLNTKTMLTFINRITRLKDQTKQKDGEGSGKSIIDIVDLLRLICSASEFDGLPVRHNEDLLNVDLMKKVKYPVSINEVAYPHVKAFLLLQAAFGRVPLPISDYQTDLKSICDQIVRVVQAVLDILVQVFNEKEDGILLDVLRTINVLQMIIQYRWIWDSPLLTIPGMASNAIKACESAGMRDLPTVVGRISDFERILKSSRMKASVSRNAAKFVRTLPILDLKFENSRSRGDITLKCDLVRNGNMPRFGKVTCSFPKDTGEGWIFVLGDDLGRIHDIKRISSFQKKTIEMKVKQRRGGRYTLYCMSDCYIGMDRVEEVSFLSSDDV